MICWKASVSGFMALLLSTTTTMTSAAQPVVVYEPDQLLFAGSQSRELRTITLFLRSNNPVNPIKVTVYNLYRSDGAQLSSSNILTAQPASNQLVANQVFPIPVQLNSTQLASGEYTSKVLVQHPGGDVLIPVLIRMKDPWFLPLSVLVLGVLIGTGLSLYRDRGKPRDELLLRIWQLRKQVENNPNLASCFREDIEKSIVDVESTLLAEQWEDARRSLLKAELTLGKWRKEPSEWQKQLDYCQTELMDKIKHETAEIPYLRIVQDGLEGLQKSAPDLKDAQELREQLNQYRSQIERFRRLQALLDQLDVQRSQVTNSASQESFRETALLLRQRLYYLSPTEVEARSQPDAPSAYEQLRQDIEAAIREQTAEITQAIKMASPDLPGNEVITRGRLQDAILQFLAPSPDVRASASPQETPAKLRLNLFKVFSYIVTLILLAGAGFNQLYITKPTFGASPWSDYLSLLAWGFGAEATRDAVTKVVRDWGGIATKNAIEK